MEILYRPNMVYRMGDRVLEKTKKEKDLGVIIQSDLSPEGHVNKVMGECLAILANIRVSFNYLDGPMMKSIIEAMLRPKVEYGQVVWSPHLKKHVSKLERVQRTATKMIPGLENLSYEERLDRLDMVTLEERRYRGDVIQLYKIVRGVETVDNENYIELDVYVSEVDGDRGRGRPRLRWRDGVEKYIREGGLSWGGGQADDGGQGDMEAICSWPPLTGLRRQAIDR